MSSEIDFSYSTNKAFVAKITLNLVATSLPNKPPRSYTTFNVDLYVLPISGANVVLGVHWLKSLGPVLTDYNHLTMQFFYEGNLIHLQGDMDAALSSLSSLQFRRLSRKNRDGLYYHITLLPNVDTSTQDLPPSILTLLTKYDTLFHPPNTLPPTRDTDHHIPPPGTLEAEPLAR